MRRRGDALEVAHRFLAVAVGTEQLQIRDVATASADVVNFITGTIAAAASNIVSRDDSLTNDNSNLTKPSVVAAGQDVSKPYPERLSGVGMTDRSISDPRAVIADVLGFIAANGWAEKLCVRNGSIAVRARKRRLHKMLRARVDRWQRFQALALAHRSPKRVQGTVGKVLPRASHR